jgi:nucleoside 2-deoxyribosyltransferase
MSELLRCYIASPHGFTEAGRQYYAQVYLPALSKVIEPVDPWSFVSDQEIAAASASGTLRDLALRLGRRNANEIRSCTLLVAYLDGQEVDSGTAAEVGFAAALGVRCFGLRTDIRASGDLNMTVNLQLESFILQSGGGIAPCLDDLVALLGCCT